MKAFAILGMASFMIAGLVIGARLLWVGRRTRQIPELTIGAAFLIGPLGYSLIVIAPFEPLVRHFRAVAWGGDFAIQVSTAAIFLAVWRIYRPGARWARAAFGTGAGLCALAFAASVATIERPLEPEPLARWLRIATGVVAYAWASGEGIRYAGLLRRRLRLGLADPELVNRFQCWVVSSSATLLVFVLSAVNHTIVETGYHPTVLTFQSALGLVSAFANWLTFFPPAFYRAWLLRGAAAQEA